tara:strand:- start:699 stop:1244 length:546 start_codon:yes stop_codon:yes gene_type:complete
MKWKDMQTAVFDRNLASIQFNTNIGDAVIQGIETDLTLLTENGFTIIAGAAFTDPELDDNFILSGVIQATPGTQLANVSKHKFSLAINKEFQTRGGRDGYWDLNLTRTGKRKSSLSNPVDQGAYTLGNLSATLEGENWATVLYVDNLFDTRAVIMEYSGYRPETKFTNRPREMGMRLKYKF